jgi:hypothetical protein
MSAENPVMVQKQLGARRFHLDDDEVDVLHTCRPHFSKGVPTGGDASNFETGLFADR